MRGKPVAGTVLALGAAAVLLGACVGTGVDTVEEFDSALESGAPCNQLFEMRENFHRDHELEHIDSELERIGCEDRDSERTDR
jgi:hypothetical protein